MPALLLQCLFRLLCLFPPRMLGALGAGVGRVLYWLLPKFRDIALRNLRRAYPDKDDAWHRRTAWACFAELGRSMLELPHVFLRSRGFLLERVEACGLEAFLRERKRAGGAILVSAHHGNWELGGLMLSAYVSDVAMIYRPMRNASLDAFLRRCRQRFGMRTYSRFESMRWLPGFLRQGGALAIMVDQHMSQGRQIPFMGHLACTTTLPAALALRQKLPIYSVSLHRQGRGFRFQLRFSPVSLPAPSGEKERDEYRIMEVVGERIARIIDERPEDWLWIHKRWWILEHDPHALSA